MKGEPAAIRVIEAAEQDISAISDFFWEMWREAGPDAPGFTGATEGVIAEISAAEAIRPRVGGPERRMHIAYEHDRVVGFAATKTIDEATIELAGIVVLATMTGRGIGTPLVAAAVESARSEGYVSITVSTETDNNNAIAFYQARGFSQTGTSMAHVEGVDVEVVHLAMEL